MESEPIHILTLKSKQQRPEFVNPGKGPFNDEAFLVHLTIELPLPSTFDCFPVAFVLWNVGTHASIPQHLPCFSCVKTAIRVEKGRPILQTIALQISKDLGDGCSQVIAVIMATTNDLTCSHNVAIPVNHWNDVAGLRFLSPLVLDTFAPFFATVWLPSRLRTDKFNSYLIDRIPASNKRWRLPSLLHL